MSNLTLVPDGIALYLALAALLLLVVGMLAARIPWFKSGPAVLQADRLLLGIIGPLVMAAALTAHAITTMINHLHVFHHMPHLCLDRTMATSLGSLAVFAAEGAALWTVAVVARQIGGALRLSGQYHSLSRRSCAAVSPKVAAAVAQVRQRIGARFSGFQEVDLPESNAFVVGAFQPRCVLSRSLVERLSPAELTAVVAHEAAHVRRGDPRVRLLVFACRRIFGFLPPVRALLSAWEEAAEVAADDMAVEATGYRLELAGALLTATSQAPHPTPALVGGPSHLVIHRIERLLMPPSPVAGLPRLRRFSLVVAVALILVFLLAAIQSPLVPSLHCLVENVVQLHGITIR